MNPLQRSSLRSSAPAVTRLGFGGAGIGNLVSAVSDEQAQQTVAAAWAGGIRYFDTAPWYGLGLSEHRVGAFLRGRPRQEYVLSTKVGRLLRPWPRHRGPLPGADVWPDALAFQVRFDYSYPGIVRAWEDSLQRLGVPEVDMLLVHDLDHFHHHPAGVYEAHLGQLSNGGFDALRDLRSDGKISAIGVGVNAAGTMTDILDRFEDVDFFLVAGPYTLLEQSVLEAELARADAAGVRVVIGAAYRAGVLATGSRGLDPRRRARLGPDILDRADRLEVICARHRVPLGAAALQFPLAHPAVASVLVGAMHPDQVRQALDWTSTPLPDDLWADFKDQGLLPTSAPVPSSNRGANA